MALWDSSDLLSRVKFLSNRPTTDESVTDAQWYSLITEGQSHWTNVISAQAPWVLMGPPTALTSTDGGVTFPFPGCVFPLAVEMYDTTTPARLLRPCTYWDSSGDYVWEGDHIRFPQGQTNPLAVSPVARYINPPGQVDGTNPPTLQPPQARLLCVYRACAHWAERGGMRDPKPYFEMEQRYWLGDMRTGDVGLLGALKSQNPFLGGNAVMTGSGGLLEGVSTGAGYVRFPPL